jgi:DNA adenine methylase
MSSLPQKIQKVIVPPIKCQGIKTKLVPFISENISWSGDGRWIEPFLGSGVVAFNICPERALLADTNKHIINFYKSIQTGIITKENLKSVLKDMGKNLSYNGSDYFYKVRSRFNKDGNPFDFIFLNRSCFNGLMRFNSKGEFNVPFGHKPERFSQSYITKITNQVDKVSKAMKDKDWVFQVFDWKETLSLAVDGDFVYLDPPYIGRHTDYFNTWSDDDAVNLSEISSSLPCDYALSMWLENKYRKNDHISDYWQQGTELKTISHFYHIGSTESLRNSMTEALVLKNNHYPQPALR